MSAAQGVLLLEITNADQFPGQIRRDLPFAAGFLASLGVGVRWLRFGVATTNQLKHGRDEVTLEPADLATLQAAVLAHAPARLLSTHALAPEQQATLQAARPGLSVETLPPRLPLDLWPGARFRATDGLRGDRWRPAYTYELANAGAAVHDHVALYLASFCGYARPIADNPCYRELVADGVPLADGCAFCGNAAGRREPTPAAWLSRQVRALADDRGVERAPKALLCEYLHGRADLETLAGALADTGLDARTTLHVGLRTDAVARLEPVLREHLAARPQARLGVYATGLESFVASDLERFHKGTTPADGLRAIELLRGLAQDFPGRFASTGLTLILFTPWTTPADLLTNLDTVERLGLAAEIGNLFAARLRLHPGRAITALALRQGFVIEHEPDPLLATNRRKLFGRELPWRFADPRLSPLCRLYVRLDEATADADDALSVHVRATLAERLGPPRHDWMARKLAVLVACAREVQAQPEPLSETELLQRGLARLGADRPVAASPAQAARPVARERFVRLAFAHRRRGTVYPFRVYADRPGQPAFRRAGGLAIAHEPCPADADFQRLVRLVEAAAGRTPPALDDVAAWRARIEGLLEVTRLGRAYAATVEPG